MAGASKNDSLDASSFEGFLNLTGGDGDDTFVVATGDRLANMVIEGGDGTADEVKFSVDALAITDNNFAGVTEVEVARVAAGNNFVKLGFYATNSGISTLYGGDGIDTFNALEMTTGINFAMKATKLGTTSLFASLDGGSGDDTLTVRSGASNFLDAQFTRVHSIENFVTESGAFTYMFGPIAYTTGIQKIYGNSGNTLNASGFVDPAGLILPEMNFVFATAADATTATITGTPVIGVGAAGNDTLTLTTDDQAVTDATFDKHLSIETLVLANGANTVTLGTKAKIAEIEVVVGGSGNDALTFDTTLQTALIFNGGAHTTFDSATISNAGATVADTYFTGWTSVEKLTTANGNNNITLAAKATSAGFATITGGTGNDTFNASVFTTALWVDGAAGNNSLLGGSAANTLVGGTGNDNFTGGASNDSITGGGGTDTFYGGEGNDIITGGSGTDFLCGVSTVSAGTSSEIDTLTGGGGADTFALADASNAYYNGPDAGGANYALIKDFTAGTDKLQLKTGVDYLIGGANYGALGGANCYLYQDFDSDGAVDAGENLIAAIIATGGSGTGGALTHGDLAGNRILV